MKKLILFFALVMFLLLSTPVWADSNAQSNVNSTATLNYNPINNYEAQKDKRFHMNMPYGVGLINPSQAPSAPKGWRVVLDPALEKTFNQINMGQPSREFFKPWEKPIIFARYSQSIPGVKFLKYIPKNRFEMGEFKIRGKDIVGDGQPIFLALQRLKYETGTKWFYILKNYTDKAKNAGLSVGSGGIFGKAIGPTGNDDRDMVALSSGGIAGKSAAWVDQACNIWVRAYSKKIPSKTMTAAKKVVATTAPSAYDYAGAPVFFDFDKSKIKEKIKVAGVVSSNVIALEKTATWIAKNIKSIKKKKQFISFFGYCDIRGGEKHNDWLGNERAKAVMLAVSQLLMKKYKIQPHELNNLFLYSSSGKRQPQFKRNDLNRRVDVVYGQYITTPPNQLPGIKIPKEGKNEKK